MTFPRTLHLLEVVNQFLAVSSALENAVFGFFALNSTMSLMLVRVIGVACAEEVSKSVHEMPSLEYSRDNEGMGVVPDCSDVMFITQPASCATNATA